MAETQLTPSTPVTVDEVNVEKVVYPDVHWTVGADLVPSPLYQVYRILTNWAGKDDESLYNRFEVKDSEGNLLNSTVELSIPEGGSISNVGDNRFGYALGTVGVTITPNETMATNYPNAIVSIDGKEYDLGRLGNVIYFVMTVKDHYVDIKWNPINPDITETIRIVANR